MYMQVQNQPKTANSLISFGIANLDSKCQQKMKIEHLQFAIAYLFMLCCVAWLIAYHWERLRKIVKLSQHTSVKVYNSIGFHIFQQCYKFTYLF